MLRQIAFILLALQPILGDDIEEPCYVSGALVFMGNNINGKYEQEYKQCNYAYVWGNSGAYPYNHYEIAYESVTELNSNETTLAWVIRIGPTCNEGGIQGDTVLAKNYWRYTSTPGNLPPYWYQYDPFQKVFFTNPQMMIACGDDGLSGGEIAGIVIGSICGILLLGALLFCTIRKCKDKKRQASGRSNSVISSSSITPPMTSSRPRTSSTSDLEKAGQNESPPAYDNVVFQQEEKSVPAN